MKNTTNTTFDHTPPKTAPGSAGHVEPNVEVHDEFFRKANLTHLAEVLPREYARCQRYLHPIAIILCDVDRLRLINDGFGRDAGDEVLRTFCARARRALRVFDWLVGSAEDEFAIILPETGLSGASTVAERLRKTMHERPVSAKSGVFPFTVSVGYCAIDSQTQLAQFSSEDLLQTAREQLRLAVQNGRDRACGAAVRRYQGAECSTAERKALTTVPAPELLTLVEYDATPVEHDVWLRSRR